MMTSDSCLDTLVCGDNHLDLYCLLDDEKNGALGIAQSFLALNEDIFEGAALSIVFGSDSIVNGLSCKQIQ